MKTQIKISDTRQPSLTRAVIRQIGDRESLLDVALHGAAGGFCGFTYYSDTVKFTKAHKAEIMARLAEDAKEFGHAGVFEMLGSFRCFRGMSQEEIADGLYNPRSDSQQTVFNGLAWYAAEEIARELNPDC